MKRKTLTYKKAGVDIRQADALVKKIRKIAQSTKTSEIKPDIGGFGAVFDLFKLNFKKPLLVSSADGVGTKLKIAFLTNTHDTVGIDLVAMNVNDILTTGATPLFFLDYIATSKIKDKVLADVIRGIAKGCQLSGCALIGGEIAEMPGFYKPGEYDLAGFCVGVVEKDRILKAKSIKKGDLVIGIASSGLHSNGFSLARKVFSVKEQKRLSKELLRPTRIYVKPVLSLLNKLNTKSGVKVKAMAHVTGGAFYQKVAKILPKGKSINICKNSWPIPKIFRTIKEKGNIKKEEMFSTFNMGIGFVLVVDKKVSSEVINHLKKFKLKAWIIGEVITGKQEVIID